MQKGKGNIDLLSIANNKQRRTEMKVVINNCWGGFGLSQGAIRKLHKMKDEHVRKTSFKKYFNGGKADKDHLRICDIPTIGENVLTDDHSNRSNRSCKNLIKVVEEMGEKSWGKNAK